MRTIVVTRHPALVALLVERGIVGEDTAVLTHVEDPETIRDARVVGVLPLDLAVLCAEIVIIPLALTPADHIYKLADDYDDEARRNGIRLHGTAEYLFSIRHYLQG